METIKKQVLVIDDESIIRRGFEKELGDQGYNVESVSNGNDAINMVKEKKYDLIFIDLVLPDMDGIQVCKNIKVIDNDVKMVFMTGNTEIDPIYKEMEFVDAGGKTYQLYKPFVAGEIVEIAKKALAS